MYFIYKTIYVSCVHHYNLTSVYRNKWSLPQIYLSFIAIQLILFTGFVYPLAPFPVVIANCSLYLWVHFVLFCLLIWFFFFVSSYEWNNMVFIFLHLIYFMQHNSVKVHQCCKCQNFILFYGWVVFIVFIYKTSFLSIYSLTGT